MTAIVSSVRRIGAAAAAVAAVCALPAAALAAGDVGIGRAPAAGDAEKGRTLAEKHCSRCHVVGTHNPLGGANNTASFQMIIRMSDGLERFQTFYARRPHPVFLTVDGVPRWSKAPSYAAEFSMTLDQVDDIVAFVRTLKSVPVERLYPEPVASKRSKDLGKALLSVIARPNVASTAFIAQQYDHEVQGTSVTKPLQGRGRVNADAGVLQPLPNSKRGIVLSHGYCPWYSAIDTKRMAAAAIDTAVRNAICAGASRDYLAILDNFCWSTSNTPERLFELKKATEACFEVATAYGTPFISGKDSMFNDFRGFTNKKESVHIAALPTLLVSVIGVIPDVRRAVTLDLKQPRDALYVIGETNDELGASEYFMMLAESGGKNVIGSTVPSVDVRKNAKSYDALTRALKKGYIASALSVGRGGLGVALAKAAIAGQLGMEVDLSKISGSAKAPDSILFSESQGRMLVSVHPEKRKAFESLMRSVACKRIGEVTQGSTVDIALPKKHIRVSLTQLTNAYRKTFQNW